MVKEQITLKGKKAKVTITVPKGAQPQNSQSKQSTKKKKQKNMKNLPAIPAVDLLASEGGQSNEQCAHARQVMEKMMGTSELSLDGRSSVMTILNPCGELGSNENAKFPDGTLSQSGVQRFRQFETIVAPWQTVSSSANVTNNWSLYIVSPGCFRTIAILIAVKDGRALTDSDFVTLFTLINAASPIAQYPAWDSSGSSEDSNIFYSHYVFKSANLNLDPETGESTTIESMRVVGDGFVVMHNTPDLWNQGSFAVGQFKTDFINATTDTTNIPIIAEFIYLGPGIGTGNIINAQVRFYYVNGDGTENELGIYANSAINQSTIYTFDVPESNPTPPGLTFDINLQSPDNRNFIHFDGTTTVTCSVVFTWTGTPSVNTVVNAQIFNTADPELDQDIVIVGRGVGTYSQTLEGEGELFSRFANFVPSNPTQLILSLPALNQDSVAQADPKFSAELMKAHQGFYCVRRYFEPKLNMTNSNSSGPIKFEVPGMQRQDVINAPGGIKGDLLDKNASTIICPIRGISYACSPTIKSDRFIEFMPAKDSPLAPFVGPTPAKDEDAEEIFRQMQLEGPHSYIPDANMLGFLASFVMGVVEKVPVFLRTARSISSAVVKALDWAESKVNLVPQF